MTSFRTPARDFHRYLYSSRNDPTPDRGSQLPRAASLVVSSLGFIHDLRAGILEPDTVRGIPLDMDQYSRLFGTSRIPTDVRLEPLLFSIIFNSLHLAWLPNGSSPRIKTYRCPSTRPILFVPFHCHPDLLDFLIRTSYLDWFDVLDEENRPVLTEREVLRNLQAIVTDADKTNKSEVCAFQFSLSLSPNINYILPLGCSRCYRCPLN